ncbi:MAG: VWA domain-containing protein [Verrucomicrobiota bacterium]
MRTLFLLALLLAFLKPVLPQFGSNAQNKAGRSVLLVIDQSLSMEAKSEGLSCRQRAENEADKIFNTLGPDDAVNVMLVGSTATTCFVDFSRSHAEAERFVQGIGPGLGRADFSQANASAAHLLARAGQRAEIYYFSDFQRKNWANVDFSMLPPEARFFFVDVTRKPRENRAILGVTMNQSQVLAGDTVTLEIEIGNYCEQPMREPVKVVLDARVSFEKEVMVAPWSVAKLTIPVPPGAPGLHLCEVRIAPDDLSQDDLFFLTIPVLEKEGILIVSDAPDPKKDAVRYLKTALNPYENAAGSLLPQQLRTNEISAARLASVRKLFFTRAGVLNEATCKLLADFLFHGGGMVYFIDGDQDAANLLQLEKALLNVPLPLRIGSKRVAKNVGTGLQQISKGDFKSRFLRLFRGPQRQNLALLEFYDIHDASSTGSGQVLLHYADETPAVALLNHGLGTLLLMNFSVSEFSSNLARQRIFPAWMQDIVKNLASDEQVAASSLIGELVEDEVWKSELVNAPLRKPSGPLLTPRAESLGERVAISFVPDELGFYSMRGNRLLHAYGVNASPEESDLRAIDQALLPEQLGSRGQQAFFVQGQEDFQNLVLGRPIFHWFIFAALGLLLVELGFQHMVKGRGSR